METLTETVTRIRLALLFTLYQLLFLVGLAFLPVALVARRFGVRVPFHRVLRRLDVGDRRTVRR